jgi:tetratricopeptide (TPR) repeat protein
MTARGTFGLVVALFFVFGLLASAAGLQYVREQRYPRPVVNEETVLITSGNALRRMTIGYRALAADLYWIRAIQHYGQTRIALTTTPAALAPRDGTLRYELLYPLLDLTTTLDPRFNLAYRFGAVFLSAPLPAGAGRPDLAVALLEKGLRESPGKWEYMHDIGFVYYWDLHDYPKAAEYFNRGADIPGAPWWLRSVAATTLARGGDRGASRLLWRQLYETAPDDRGRQAAGLKLLQLDALDQIEDLQKRIDAFAEKRGERLRSWQMLVAAGVLPGIPVDPGGTPYELSDSGRVTLSMSSTLFPLPLEPGSRSGPG